MHVKTSPALLSLFLLLCLLLQGTFEQKPMVTIQNPSSITSTYSVVAFNGNQSFLIQIQQRDKSFTTPRGYYYMGVGGYGFSPAGVSIWNSSGSKVGDTRATNGILWIPRLPVGNYTVTTADRGSFLLAQDVQNSGDRFVGNISTPIALFMVPFQRGGIHVDIQVSHPSDGYRVDLYNSSLSNIYSQRYTGGSSFDFTLPSNGASLAYARISPEQTTVVQYSWKSAPAGVDIIGLFPVIFPVALIAALVVFVVIRSRRKV